MESVATQESVARGMPCESSGLLPIGILLGALARRGPIIGPRVIGFDARFSGELGHLTRTFQEPVRKFMIGPWTFDLSASLPDQVWASEQPQLSVPTVDLFFGRLGSETSWSYGFLIAETNIKI